MTDKTEERLGDAYQLAGQMSFDNPTIDFVPLLDMLAYADADGGATRTPDPTPVALSDEESFRQMHLLYNYIDDDSIQFTRWQMVIAMAHGMRLARPPAVPADGLVEALRAELAWHEDHDKAISKQPNANTGDNGWRRMEHQERIRAVTTALAAHRGEA